MDVFQLLGSVGQVRKALVVHPDQRSSPDLSQLRINDGKNPIFEDFSTEFYGTKLPKKFRRTFPFALQLSIPSVYSTTKFEMFVIVFFFFQTPGKYWNLFATT